MGRYDRRIPAPICERKHHAPAGTMSNQPGTEPYDRNRPHAGTHVCARTECQDDAREWVRAHTGEDSVFTTFEQNRAASAERKAAEDAQTRLPIGGGS